MNSLVSFQKWTINYMSLSDILIMFWQFFSIIDGAFFVILKKELDTFWGKLETSSLSLSPSMVTTSSSWLHLDSSTELFLCSVPSLLRPTSFVLMLPRPYHNTASFPFWALSSVKILWGMLFASLKIPWSFFFAIVVHHLRCYSRWVEYLAIILWTNLSDLSQQQFRRTCWITYESFGIQRR